MQKYAEEIPDNIATEDMNVLTCTLADSGYEVSNLCLWGHMKSSDVFNDIKVYLHKELALACGNTEKLVEIYNTVCTASCGPNHRVSIGGKQETNAETWRDRCASSVAISKCVDGVQAIPFNKFEVGVEAHCLSKSILDTIKSGVSKYVSRLGYDKGFDIDGLSRVYYVAILSTGKAENIIDLLSSGNFEEAKELVTKLKDYIKLGAEVVALCPECGNKVLSTGGCTNLRCK